MSTVCLTNSIHHILVAILCFFISICIRRKGVLHGISVDHWLSWGGGMVYPREFLEMFLVVLAQGQKVLWHLLGRSQKCC